MDLDEHKLEERRLLLNHCDHFFRPPASFYAELEKAIHLAATDRASEAVSFDGDSVLVSELIDEYQLEEFVERAKVPERDRTRTCRGSMHVRNST